MGRNDGGTGLGGRMDGWDQGRGKDNALWGVASSRSLKTLRILQVHTMSTKSSGAHTQWYRYLNPAAINPQVDPGPRY